MADNQDPTEEEKTPTPEEGNQPSPSPQPEPTSQGEPEPGVDWKAASRQWEARSKANKKRADEAEAKNSELASQLAQAEDKLAKASQRADGLELSLATHEIASEYQVDASLLRGKTREEIEEHAKALSAWKGAGQAAPLLGREPSKGGATPVEQFLRDLLNKNQ